MKLNLLPFMPLLALPLLAACGSGGPDQQSAIDKEVQRGAIVYRRVCSACHATNENNMVGPHLKDVLGRHIAAVAGFDYSEALAKDKDQTWTDVRLKSYLMGPMQMYPEGRMVIDPLSSADADAVIAYLRDRSGGAGGGGDE